MSAPEKISLSGLPRGELEALAERLLAENGGRDYHHWLERTNTDYAFRVLPQLVLAVVSHVLSMEPRL